jgi:hypothetical protein
VNFPSDRLTAVMPGTTGSTRFGTRKEVIAMVILLGLLLVALFFGLGFALHALWIIAIVFAVFWVAGFAFRSGEGRWYRY